MKITKIFATASFFLVLGAGQSYAQLALPNGEPDPSAILDLISKDRGMLMSRINLTSTTDALTIYDPAPTLLVYNTATSGDITPGFYYWNKHKWIRVLTDETPIEETLTTLISNGVGSYTYTNEKGIKSTINVADDVKKYETLTKLAYSPVNKSLSYIDEKGLSTLLDLSALTGAMGIQGATGPAGVKGSDGRGISNAAINSNGNLIVTYSDGTTKDTGIVKGPIGATGPKGADGATGLQGIQGLPGATGANGAPGPKGDAGAAGAKGDTGAQGIAGVKGVDGLKGLDGRSITNSVVDTSGNLIITYSDGTNKNTGPVKGATGANGAAGPKGDAGAAGAKGDTGAQGIAGVKGVDGLKGLDGRSITNSVVDTSGNLIITYSDGTNKNTGPVKGATGANGATGAKGDTGAQGIAGVKGLDGRGINSTNINSTGNLIVTYSDGTTRDTGLVKGANGLDGKSITNSIVDANGNLIITYSDGTTKNTGLVKGATGANGAAGPKGDAGIEGVAGVKGSNGLDGKSITNSIVDANGNLIITYSDGTTKNTGLVKGATGANGAVGPKGDTGAAGAKGDTGAQGMAGATGSAGLKGLDGKSIINSAVDASGNLIITYSDGTNKNTGLVKGATGANGTAGPKGDAGAAGAKGDTGAQGIAGATGPAGLKGLDGKSITNSAVDTSGNLIITYSDGTNKNTGLVKGATGANGAAGPKGDSGAPGTAGVKGLDGRGINSTNINSTGNLIVTYSDGTTRDTGLVKGATGATGPKGDTGAQGIVGATGPAGTAPSSGAGTVTGKNLIAVSNGANNAFKNSDISLTPGANGQVIQTVNGNPVWANQTGDNLGNHTATQDLEMSSKNINNINAATIKYNLIINDRLVSNSNPFSIYKNNGLFGIWNSKQSVNSITVNESSNNVGISTGTDAPGQKLTVNGNGSFKDELFIDADSNSNGSVRTGLVFGDGTSGEGITSNRTGTENKYGMDFWIGNSKLLSLASGTVGIGTTSPSNRLHIAGSNNPLRLEGLQTGVLNEKLLSTDANGVVHKLPMGSSGQALITDNSGNFGWSTVVGTKGDKGEKGDTGSQGAVGPQGATGSAPTFGAGTVTGKNLIAVSNGANNAFKNSDISLTPGANGQVIQTVNGNPVWANQTGDNLGNHTASQDLEMNSKSINNINTATIKYNLVINDRLVSNSNPFSLYKNNGVFGIWNSSKNSNSLVVKESTNDLGVGTDAPSNRLHIAGSNNPLRLEGLQNGAGTDKLLSTDASGVVRKLPMGSNGQTLAIDGTGNLTWANPVTGDNLGNHTAEKTLDMNSNVINYAWKDGNKIQFLGKGNAARIEHTQGFNLKSVTGSQGEQAGEFSWANYNGPNASEIEEMRLNKIGNLGVGTNNPGQKLTVNGNASFKDELFIDSDNSSNGSVRTGLVFGDGTSGEGITSNRTGTENKYGMDFWTGNGKRVSIAGNGNVGINNTNPAGKLDVTGNTNISDVLRLDSDNNSNGSVRTGLAFGDVNSGEGITSNRTGTENKYGLDFWTGAFKRMVVTSAGRVGINTIAPNAIFNVNAGLGYSHFEGTQGHQIVVDNNSSSLDGPSEILFVNNNNGYVVGGSPSGIGRNIFGISRVTNVTGSKDNDGLRGPWPIQSVFIIDGDKSNNFAIGGGLTVNGVFQGADVNYKLRVYGNVAATEFKSLSDRRYKKDITPIIGALDMIKRVQGVGYNWRINEFKEMNFNDKHQLGVIAQDIEKIVPEAVTKDEKGFYTVNYIMLVPVLVEAVKEQQKEIDANETKIQSLEKNQEAQQKELAELKAMILKMK